MCFGGNPAFGLTLLIRQHQVFVLEYDLTKNSERRIVCLASRRFDVVVGDLNEDQARPASTTKFAIS